MKDCEKILSADPERSAWSSRLQYYLLQPSNVSNSSIAVQTQRRLSLGLVVNSHGLGLVVALGSSD